METQSGFRSQDGLATKWKVGMEVDVWYRTSWQAAEVTGVTNRTKRLDVVMIATSRATTVKWENARRRMVWEGGEFMHTQGRSLSLQYRATAAFALAVH